MNDTSRLGHKVEQTEVRRRRPVILGQEGYEATREPAVVCRFLGAVFVCVQATGCISDSGSAGSTAHVLLC